MDDLRRLLRWAKKNGMYIEIYRDGSAEVEAYETPDGYYEFLASGKTLLSALRKAEKTWQKQQSTKGNL